MKTLDITVEAGENFKAEAESVWRMISPEDHRVVQVTVFTAGTVNKLACLHYGSKPGKDSILVRVFGPGTEEFVNRERELATIFLLHETGLGPRLYGSFSNGIIYGYTPGTMLDITSAKDPAIYPLVAQAMACFNKIQPEPILARIADQDPDLQNLATCFGDGKSTLLTDKFPDFLQIIRESSITSYAVEYVSIFGGQDGLEAEVSSLMTHLAEYPTPVVICHNDLNFPNALYDSTNSVVNFIDFEFAGYNYQPFDIAGHFCEFAGLDINDIDFAASYPCEEFRSRWIAAYLREYFGEEPSDDVLLAWCYSVEKYALGALLFWGVACIASHVMIKKIGASDDFFLKYGCLRLLEYKRRKEGVFALPFLPLA